MRPSLRWAARLFPVSEEEQRQCHGQSPSAMSHDSSQLAVSSTVRLTKPFWQAPIWRTMQTHLLPLQTSLLLPPFVSPLRFQHQLIDLCQYWMSETQFKDAFGFPLIIHTTWIINNNSHRAIIQLYHLPFSFHHSPQYLSSPLFIHFLP